MGLIELLIAGLCFNATCPGDHDYDLLSTKKLHRMQLIEELQHETLTVTTLRNGLLSNVNEIQHNLNTNSTSPSELTGTGIAFDLLDILARKFRFNYTVKLPATNVWGSDKTGVLDMLKNNEASIAAAFLPQITEYTDDIVYSPSLDTGEWVVLMKRPKESATGSGLLAPFTLPVWILILFSLLVVGPIIYGIIYVQARLCNNQHDDDIGMRIFPLHACIWFVYGALLKQGTTLNPITDSSRLLFSTWWIFITILTAFYTANLTAFLTLSRFTLPINVPQDIGAKRSKWITNKGNALEDSLHLEGDLSSVKLRALLGHPQTYVEHDDRLILDEYVLKRNWMFLREKPIVEYIMFEDYKRRTKAGIQESDRCIYVITRFSVVRYPRGFAYAKQFKYRSLFDEAIQQLVESGIIQFKLREQLPDTQICPLNLGNKERQLRNADLLMTYLIVGGGFIISTVIFVLEFVVSLCKRRLKATRGRRLHGVVDHAIKFSKAVIVGGNGNNLMNHDDGDVGGGVLKPTKFVSPPPSYHTLFNPPMIYSGRNMTRRTINGRDYWVSDDIVGGERTMIPIRAPSALLFQFTN